MKRKSRRPAAELDQYVLDVIGRSHTPVTAYAIVEHSKTVGQPLVPMQVYRSIDRLLRRRYLDRVVTMNAYVATRCRHAVHFLCRDCGSYRIEDEGKVHDRLAAICKGAGFSPCATHLEVSGQCPQCKLDSVKDAI